MASGRDDDPKRPSWRGGIPESDTVGSNDTHVPVLRAIFNNLAGSFVLGGRTIALREPTLPAKLLILKELKLAERVGFELDQAL